MKPVFVNFQKTKYLLAALDIVQDEQYLEDSDFDEIRVLKRNGRAAFEIKKSRSSNSTITSSGEVATVATDINPTSLCQTGLDCIGTYIIINNST